MRRSTYAVLVPTPVLVLVLALALAGAGGAFAQSGPDLTPLYGEFGVLFDELGRDTLSHALPFGLLMEGTGRAEIGKCFFVSASGGAAFLPGILTFRDDPVSPFAYLGGLLSSIEGMVPPGIGQTLYQGSTTFFLNPGLRLSAGLALASGLELWGHFGIVPQAVAAGVGGLVGVEGLVLNRMNAGGRVRFVLVHDRKGLPAVSIGAGYTYTQFNVGIADLSAFDLTGLAFSGFDVALAGELGARTRLHTAGVELAISKKLLFLAPFLKLGAWYQWASYTAGIQGLTLTLSSDPASTADDIVVSGHLDQTVRTIHDLAFVVSGGLELVFGKVSLILEGSYDTSSATPAADASLQFRL